MTTTPEIPAALREDWCRVKATAPWAVDLADRCPGHDDLYYDPETGETDRIARYLRHQDLAAVIAAEDPETLERMAAALAPGWHVSTTDLLAVALIAPPRVSRVLAGALLAASARSRSSSTAMGRSGASPSPAPGHRNAPSPRRSSKPGS